MAAMKRTILAGLASLALFSVHAAAPAVLPQGTKAPQIVSQGALAGKPFNFNLAQALRAGFEFFDD